MASYEVDISGRFSATVNVYDANSEQDAYNLALEKIDVWKDEVCEEGENINIEINKTYKSKITKARYRLELAVEFEGTQEELETALYQSAAFNDVEFLDVYEDN